MSAALQSRWLDWQPKDKSHAAREKVTDKADKRVREGAFVGFVSSVFESAPETRSCSSLPEARDVRAALLRNTAMGDLWLVSDEETLVDHPDILRSGLPVIFFDEVEQLRGKTLEELRALGAVKASFPTSRVLQ